MHCAASLKPQSHTLSSFLLYIACPYFLHVKISVNPCDLWMRCGSYSPSKKTTLITPASLKPPSHTLSSFLLYIACPYFLNVKTSVNPCNLRTKRSSFKNPCSVIYGSFPSLPRAPSLLLARTEPRPPLIPLHRLTEPTLQRRCRKKNVQIFVTLAERLFKLSLYESRNYLRFSG